MTQLIESYVSPKVEVVTLFPEKGFATSPSNTLDDISEGTGFGDYE